MINGCAVETFSLFSFALNLETVKRIIKVDVLYAYLARLIKSN